MVATLVTPVRSAWADRDNARKRMLPSILSVAPASTVTLLFVEYGNALTYGGGDVVIALSTMEEHLTADLAVDLAVTNLVLLVPILAMARRRTLPFGLATAVYSTAATLSGALTGFRNGDLLLGVIVAGVGVDLLARLLRPGPRPLIRCRVFAAAAALLTWTTYIAMAYLTCPPLYQPVTAIPEVVTGAPIVQALLALLVSVLLPPGEGSNRQARRNAERHGNAAGTARRATVR